MHEAGICYNKLDACTSSILNVVLTFLFPLSLCSDVTDSYCRLLLFLLLAWLSEQQTQLQGKGLH